MHCHYHIQLGNQLPALIRTDPATSVAMQQPQEIATGQKNQQGKLFYLSMCTHNSQNLCYDNNIIFVAQVGCLNPNDLRKVLRTIWEARTEWYNLGLELEITSDTLDSIELSNRQNPDRCFRAMLTKWLREHKQPSWSALAEALTSPSVGLSHLAQEILEKN